LLCLLGQPVLRLRPASGQGPMTAVLTHEDGLCFSADLRSSWSAGQREGAE
jgi:hypothetical protein